MILDLVTLICWVSDTESTSVYYYLLSNVDVTNTLYLLFVSFNRLSFGLG